VPRAPIAITTSTQKSTVPLGREKKRQSAWVEEAAEDLEREPLRPLA